MSISSQVVPVMGKHSIKEVVLSLFLVEPIPEPVEFMENLKRDFKDRFDSYEPVSNYQVQFRKNKSDLQTLMNHNPNAGFKITKSSENNPQLILQGINEPGRSFISYHSLAYTSWNDFIEEFILNIEAISRYKADISIHGFSLHYIDELIWKGKGPIDKTMILKKNKDRIPGDFFTTRSPAYSLISEKNIKGSIYFDRLEIKVQNLERSSMIISHNVSQNLDDPIFIENLYNPDFKQKIEDMHSYNKELLSEILQDDIQTIIGLKG